MITPNIEGLIAALTQTNQFHESADICTADVIDVLQSQAERIKELEAECEVERLRLAACGVAALGYFDGCKDEYKSASLDDVLRLNKRCDTLRAELGDLPEAQAEMLAEIAATEPVAARWPTVHGSHQYCGCKGCAPMPGMELLFTRPMPAESKDAERYRWFADIAVNGYFDKAEKAFACFESAESCTKQELDAAIDAAIEGAK